MLNGGYIMVSKTDTDLYKKLNNALTLGKPVLFYENDTTCYYIDTIALIGDDIVLTKGGKTITIEADGDITESGSIQPVAPEEKNLFCHYFDIEDDDDIHSFYFYQLLPFDVLNDMDLTASTLNDNTKEYLTNLSKCVNANGGFIITGSDYCKNIELQLYKSGSTFSIRCVYNGDNDIEDYEFVYSISNDVVNAFVEAKHNNNVTNTSYIIVEKIF